MYKISYNNWVYAKRNVIENSTSVIKINKILDEN